MYKLDFDLDLSNTGTQAYATNARGNGFDLIHSMDCSKLPQEGMVFDCIVLEDDTSPTDFISLSNPCGHFVLSNRIKMALEKHILSKATLFPAKLFWKGEFLKDEYSLVWLYGNELDRVDFLKTRFTKLKGWIPREQVDLPQLDKQQLLREFVATLDEPNETIRVKGKYYFLSSISDLGMFRIGEFDNWVYISDGLADDLKRLNPSGIEFLEAIEV